MDALLAQLPDDLPQTRAQSQDAPRQRGFSASLLRERIELTLSDEQKARGQQGFFTKVKGSCSSFRPSSRCWRSGKKAVFERDGEGDPRDQPPRTPAGQMYRHAVIAGLHHHLEVRRWPAAIPVWSRCSSAWGGR